MPYVDDGKGSVHYYKISKKEEEALKKKGFRAYDVRYGVSFPRGAKIKVWAKNKKDAYDTGQSVQSSVMMAPTVYGHAPEVRSWGKPKSRMKRKGNPRFRPVKIRKIHPKTGKRFTQIVYKHSKDWWKK